jgi:hypothetical protein
MLLKADLKRIAQARLKDAKVLLDAERYDGATYLCGYAIELGLKLRICKTLKWNDFPEKNREFDGLLSFKTHNLDTLLRLSGIEEKVKRLHFAEWSAIKTWTPEDRYKPIGTMSKQKAVDLIQAVTVLFRIL